MRENKIKEIWQNGNCATLGWLSVSHGMTAEIMARQGFDALCVDLQHGISEMRRFTHAASYFPDRYSSIRKSCME